MLNTLRAQRHDFLNHLHSLTGYIQLGKLEKAYSYMNELITKHIYETDCQYTTKLQLNGLLFKMVAVAEEKGVKVYYTLAEELEAGIPVPATRIARILGNLLRDTIETVEKLLPEQRWIELSVEREKNSWNLLMHTPELETPVEYYESFVETELSARIRMTLVSN